MSKSRSLFFVFSALISRNWAFSQGLLIAEINYVNVGRDDDVVHEVYSFPFEVASVVGFLPNIKTNFHQERKLTIISLHGNPQIRL